MGRPSGGIESDVGVHGVSLAVRIVHGLAGAPGAVSLGFAESNSPGSSGDGLELFADQEPLGPYPAPLFSRAAAGGAMREDRRVTKPCVFCAIVAGEHAAHMVLDDEVAVAFLDIRPLFPGHTLLIPRAHHVTLTDLPADLVEPFFTRMRLLTGAVQEAMEAAGSFVAMNNIVSQSVPHLHSHIVPRNRKDGLRGFFWPRGGYESDAHAADVAARIRTALDARP